MTQGDCGGWDMTAQSVSLIHVEKEGQTYARIPMDMHTLHLLSKMAAELLHFNSNQCVCLQLLRVPALLQLWQPSTTDTQDLYFCQMPEHKAAIQHRAGCVEQVDGYRNKKNHPVISN